MSLCRTEKERKHMHTTITNCFVIANQLSSERHPKATLEEDATKLNICISSTAFQSRHFQKGRYPQADGGKIGWKETFMIKLMWK